MVRSRILLSWLIVAAPPKPAVATRPAHFPATPDELVAYCKPNIKKAPEIRKVARLVRSKAAEVKKTARCWAVGILLVISEAPPAPFWTETIAKANQRKKAKIGPWVTYFPNSLHHRLAKFFVFGKIWVAKASGERIMRIQRATIRTTRTTKIAAVIIIAMTIKINPPTRLLKISP